MNMYELNQMQYATLPTYGEKDIIASEDIVYNFLKEFDSQYYMLLNNESKYYTVFHRDNSIYSEVDRLHQAHEIVALVCELGEIKSIERTADSQAVEFWIIFEGECRVFYLFDYGKGVVELN